jgi:CDP-glycerol glycerophosphotransferase
VFDRLEVSQDGQTLRIRLRLGAGVAASGLWARVTGTDQWLPLADVPSPAGGECVFDLDLQALPRPDAEDGAALALAMDVEQILPVDSDAARRLGAAGAEVVRSGKGQVTLRHRASLGRSRVTSVAGLHEVGDERVRATPYLNARGGLSIAVNRPLNPFGSVHVSRLVIRRGVLRLRGRIATRHGDLRTAHLVLKARTSGRRLVRPVPFAFDPARSEAGYGLRWYDFDVRLDCSALLTDAHAADDTYDTWFRLTTAQNPTAYEVRVGRTRLLTRYLTRPGWARREGRAVAIAPYYTFKAKRTSFNVNHFDAGTLAYMRRQLRLRHVLRLIHGRRQVWLIGERPYKAQDNGYWFFRYLREHHPEIEAYYVIARDSPERANVEPFGNVVDFGSREHIRLTLLADKVVGTHHPDFLYPLRTKEFDRAVRATKVFLQHGVMGTKWMTSLYGKWTAGFDTDLVIVSSEREREYLVTDFGYDLDEVAVTGLPRFDSLLAGDVPTNPRQLLIMPTWRDWLQDLDAYPESEYHLTWSALLHDPRLRDLVEEHQLELVFCLHANMQHYRHLFADVPARVISQGEVDVQRLLKQSAMLVTDYSSVGFDFSFLHKPVTYYQFDREQFLGAEGSHLDLDEELPGPIFRSAGSVLADVRARAATGFAMDPEYVARADRFLAVRDRSNSERVFEAVRSTRRRLRLRDRVMANELVSAVPRYLRRHRFYFPLMRRMLRLAKLLPADGNLVVFESGLGKQYADSPRYIYEELVRRRPDIKKVWAYAGRLPTTDPNTRVVKRLSPQYFYYLARAKFWVNNQSFPHYVTRRRDGVYVQTWHGTPLKRMLHDLPEVHGRDSGYVARATAGALQWSVLVSPNPFTTEVMRSAFRYTGEALELGYPRNDVLQRPDRDQLAARIRERLGIRPGQRVILYAPTFRDDQVQGGRFSFELPFDLHRLHDELGDDTVLLLRMHVLIGKRVEIPLELRDVVRDVSGYPEIQELYLASDVLVTDYSSVFFDYAALGRPILFYAYDLDRYRDTLRGFYLDYTNDLPGPIVETESDLLLALTNLDEVTAGYAQRRKEFLERFAPMDDGHAAERVVAEVFDTGHRPASSSPVNRRR